jgi:hypothetical protein
MKSVEKPGVHFLIIGIGLIAAIFLMIANEARSEKMITTHAVENYTDFEDCKMMHSDCRWDCRALCFSVAPSTDRRECIETCSNLCKNSYWECKKGVMFK